MSKNILSSASGTVLRHLRKTLLAGFVVLVPVIVTYLLIQWLFNFVDGILQPGIEVATGRELPGLGVLFLVMVIYAIGLLWATVLGKRAIGWAQGLLLAVPLLRALYQAAKELIESFSGQRLTGFQRVVAIEYPRSDTWAIGFLTASTQDERGRSLGVVYIPTAPTPQSGWVAILPMEQIYDVDLPVSTAMRLVLSGGVITPSHIRKVSSAAQE